jgi:outer membrane protein OmpA-like peptidoglycan-associated protein
MKSAARVVLLLSVLTLAPASALCADPPPKVISKDEIQRALQQKPRTRGITIKGKESARSVIDLDIPFEFNSSELQPRAEEQLRQLGAALKSTPLTTSRFRITGHTDAKGRADYNRALSLRRAESVRRYLESHGVDRARLEVAGAGSEQLLRPDAPEDGANRRVEVRNLGSP